MNGPATPNNALQRLIAEAGVSYEALAKTICQIAAEHGNHRLRTNRSSLAQWIAGAQPHPQTVPYLVEALSRKLGRVLTPADIGLPSGEDKIFTLAALPSDPVVAIARLGRADVDRRTLLTKTAYSIGALVLPLQQRQEIAGRAAGVANRRSAMVGMGEVQAVRDMTVAFNASDERLGGGHARTAVVEYLATDVATYLRGRFANEQTRQAMFGAAAQLAYLAGWKAHDLGMAGLAQQYYLHSFQLACEADPYAHAGYSLRILAHQAMDLGRHEHCADLAAEALTRVQGRVDADTESLFWLTAARAHSADGQARQALAALNRAEQLISRSRADQGPSWAALGGPAEARLANQAGKTLQALGDLPAAEEQLKRSAHAWNPATHRRIYALTLADLAETQCAQGRVEQACETWDRALTQMAGVSSARTRQAARSVRQHLAAHRLRGSKTARRVYARAAILA